MFCPKCNASIPDDSTFCPYCGEEKLVVEADADTEEGTEPAEVPAASNKKIRIAIIVACILVVIAAIVAAFFIGRAWGKDPNAQTPAVTDTVTTPATEGEDSTADFEYFPEDYELVYPKGFDFIGTDFSQYLTIGEYKGIEVDLGSAEVTDEEVMEYIEENILSQYPSEKEVTGRAAEVGDIVYIDYSGSIDGVVFDGGTAYDQRVIIGAGQFIEGFEEGIVGMNIGETKVVDCTFPEVYQSEELAGKTAQFTMTLHSIVVEEPAVYNDLFVSENTPYTTTEELNAYLKEALSASKAEEIENSKTSMMLDAIVANADFKGLPDGIIEDYMYGEIVMCKQYAAMYGMEYSEFVPLAVGMSVEDFETSVREMSEVYVKQEFVLWSVIEAENITATEEEVEAYFPTYLANLGVDSVEALMESSGATEEEINVVVLKLVIEQKAIEFLMENTTFKFAEN